jgi:hypothetical protein
VSPRPVIHLSSNANGLAAAARLWLPYVLLLYLVQVDAVRLDQCTAKIANETGQSGPMEIPYDQCVEMCGGGAGDFKWNMYSQGFGAWLLPWIALIFQLPFGADGKWSLIAKHMSKR